MNIVLIAPSGAVSSALERLGLDEAAPADLVTVLTWDAADAPAGPRDVITLGRPLSRTSRRIATALGGNAIGRNVLRLTPLDGGRRLARAALRDARFRSAVTGADLIVVLERDGILTGWTAARRWASAGAQAVFGLAPAETLIKIERRRRV
jgi:hypothetical protein